MTIKDCIDIVDNIKPNQYTIKDKVMWLSFIDEIIINEVLKTHEGYDGRYDDFEGYSEDKLSVPLVVSSPYDRLYTEYLKMKIDSENGETARYNNSAALYNKYMLEYRKHYNKTHLPLDTIFKVEEKQFRKNNMGLSDAEYENLRRDVIAALDDIVYRNTSPDKIYDIVTSFVYNNIELLKGKDGYTPQKGVDYFDGSKGEPGYSPVRGIDFWTNGDKAEINEYIDEQTEIIKSDIEGLQARINTEAHFRGYLSTNAKIQALEATPNDFAYSAESGTKWVYDEVDGWKDTGTPVPDQLTPASDATPLMDGVASVGTEETYARGDHRHPTDTTRASLHELNALDDKKADIGLFSIVDGHRYVYGFAAGGYSVAELYGITIGFTAATVDDGDIAIGGHANATANRAIAFGSGAKANAEGSIQIGQGKNETANTFQVFSYQLLDADGHIPNERIPQLGDIENALEGILVLQRERIGGESV